MHGNSFISRAISSAIDDDLMYPKIVVRLEFHVTVIEGTSDYQPEQLVASVSVIQKIGLVGEYEWLSLHGRDLRFVDDVKRVAAIEASLIPPLRLPPSFYDLRIKSSAAKFRFQLGSFDCFPRVTIRLIDKKGAELKIYDESYPAPRGGIRAIDDVITPELPIVHPAPKHKTAKSKAARKSKHRKTAKR